MIYTVTFNPAIDYAVYLGNLSYGIVNRSERECISYGGKGINVSVMLKRLGVENTALGFCGGFTGEYLKSLLKSEEINTDFISLKNQNTRINVKLKADGEETEVNAQGPEISTGELNKFFEKIDNIGDGDMIVLAGSVPKSIPKDIYLKILERLKDKKVLSVVDAEKDLLLNSLKFKPFLIKPNNHELEQIFNVKLSGTDDIFNYAEKLQEMGAENVMVSLAGDGAVLLDEFGNRHIHPAFKGQVVNSVGAGDSAVAGFIAGYNKSKDYAYALKLSCATGAATAFSEYLGEMELIRSFMN